MKESMNYQVGQVVLAKVSGIQAYGAFVTLDDSTNGLIHISEISNGFVKDVASFVHVGDTIYVKIIDFDETSHQARCSLKALTARKSRRGKHLTKRALLPQGNIGFDSLQAMLPIWVEQIKENMNMLQFDASHAFLDGSMDSFADKVKVIHESLHNKTCLGNDYTGWVDWPNNYDKQEYEHLKEVANRVKGKAQVLLVCGIGGSYLGARAALEFLQGLYPNRDSEIIFIGNTFSSTYLSQVLEHIKGKSVVMNVISKSGTTTETSLAFRIFKEYMEKEYGKEECKTRIIATTDKARGALKALAGQEGYETFVIPDDIGGRFSVITPVGLLPLAIMGVDIDSFMLGLKKAYVDFGKADLKDNLAYQYAVARRMLQEKGYNVEMLVSYELQMVQFGEWWKQLFGESEGKDGLGILPDSACFSTDLHSLGQFVQEGKKILFETLLLVNQPQKDLIFPSDAQDLDHMNYLAGKNVSWVNKMAMQGTLQAHEDTGHVPNLIITIDAMDEMNLAYLMYFFFKAIAMTTLLNGSNPFNQPGVEVYKKNMFKLLGKPNN